MSIIELNPDESLVPPIDSKVELSTLPLTETTVSHDVLSNSEETLIELGVHLETVAKQVGKRGDAIKREAQSAADFVGAPVGVFVGLAEIAGFGAMDVHATSAAKVGVVVGAATIAAIQGGLDGMASKKAGPLQIPNGYSIQLLRPSDTTASFTAKKPVAFVHAREYPDGESQTIHQARERLCEALQLVDLAPSVDKAVLPLKLLREAGLPERKSVSYVDTLTELRLSGNVTYPYMDGEQAVVLSREEASRVLETVQNMHKHPLLQQTVNALAERYPSMRLRLADAMDDDKKLVSILHTLLRSAADGEMPGSKRDRGYETVLRPVGSGSRVAAPAGTRQTDVRPRHQVIKRVTQAGEVTAKLAQPGPTPKVIPVSGRSQANKSAEQMEYVSNYFERTDRSLTVELDTTNRFDPVIIQRGGDYAPLEAKRLSQLIGDETLLMDGVMERLQTRGYTEVQLLAIALRLVEQREQEKTRQPVDASEEEPLNGMEPGKIHSIEDLSAIRREMKRPFTRSVAGGILAFYAVSTFASGLHVLEADNAASSGPTAVAEADLTWRVDEHGLTSAGYYTQGIYSNYDAQKVAWSGQEGFQWSVPVSEQLSDPSEPHLTVSAVTNSDTVNLPVRDGTALSALSATTQDGKILDLTLLLRNDGTAAAQVESDGELYKLTEQLTAGPDTDRTPHANRSITVADAHWADLNPHSLPLPDQMDASGDISDVANYIATNFTYDASTTWRDKLQAQKTADQYVHAIYNAGRCDCVECATAAALVAHSLNSADDVLLATGYLDQAEVDDTANGHSYLVSGEAHAWLVDSDGSIIDGTAMNQDKNSNVPIAQPISELDRQQQDGGWSTGAQAADGGSVAAASAANQSLRETLSRTSLAGLGLGGFVFISMGVSEAFARRRKIVDGASAVVQTGRLLAATALVQPEAAATAMAWQAYGGKQLPAYDANRPAPSLRNLQTSALKEIAAGGLSHNLNFSRWERRGIRALAKATLATRLQDERSPSNARRSRAKKVTTR